MLKNSHFESAAAKTGLRGRMDAYMGQNRMREPWWEVRERLGEIVSVWQGGLARTCT